MPSIEHIAPNIGFGTSGVRALVTQLDDRVVYAYCAAFLAYLKTSNQLGTAGTVILAHDLRPSSPGIAAACTVAIEAAGLRTEYAGALATPGLALRAMARGAAGIMVTGSHIPFDRNGIKFYTAKGEILKADELGIRACAFDLPEALFSGSRLAKPPALPEIDATAKRAYMLRYLAFFPADLLAGKRVGLYQHSGVARDLLAELFHDFSAEVICLGRSEQFIPIDTEAVSAEDQARASDWCVSLGLDAVVSTDGDADRPLVFDETGGFLRGDVLGILTASYLGASAVVTPVSSNTALEKSGAFRRVLRTRIGSPYVIEAMQELAGQGESVVGFEANGGFLVGTPIEQGHRHLAALPTRDAILPMLAVFALARASGSTLAQLPGQLPERYTASDRLQGIATQQSQQLLGQLAVDAPALAGFFASLGQPAEVNLTDGLRVTLDNGDIVHFRPSGNAPELRCYVEADTQARADSLLAWGIASLRRALPEAAVPTTTGTQA